MNGQLGVPFGTKGHRRTASTASSHHRHSLSNRIRRATSPKNRSPKLSFEPSSWTELLMLPHPEQYSNLAPGLTLLAAKVYAAAYPALPQSTSKSQGGTERCQCDASMPKNPADWVAGDVAYSTRHPLKPADITMAAKSYLETVRRTVADPAASSSC